MEAFKQILEYFSKLFQWWIIISPWEKAIRVRFGKNLKLLEAGTHFRIPLFDIIYLHSVRLRVVRMAPQTVTTKDGLTITISVVCGYSIKDVQKLHLKLFQPESTISNMIMGEVSTYIFSHVVKECVPSEIEKAALNKLEGSDYGIKYEYVRVTTYAIVKTYRLIQDQNWQEDNLKTDVKA